MAPSSEPTEPTEAQFLAAYDDAGFRRPSLAVDVVVLTIRADELGVLLVRRTEHPHRGKWSLPGGFVDVAVSLDDNAQRVLERKAGVRDIYLEQLYTFGAVDRDPRTRIVSVAYYALVPDGRLTAADRDDAGTCLASIAVPWAGETGGPVELCDPSGAALDIAFDHREIVGLTIKRLRGKLAYTPVGYELLPKRFTLLQLQRVHELILDAPVNKDSFRRRMLASGELTATGAIEAGVDHRPATLYRYRGRKRGS
jgi:8-oxo-dGTP diphosphatase